MPRICSLTGKKTCFGYNVSHSNRKTKRKFNPNLVKTSLRSNLLKENIRMRLATSTLRTIDYKGDLDLYLLKTKNNKLTLFAKNIKKKLLKKLAVLNKKDDSLA